MYQEMHYKESWERWLSYMSEASTFPHHLINKMLSCPGADMFRTVMHSAFWNPRAQRPGFTLVRSLDPYKQSCRKEDKIEAPRRAKFRRSTPQRSGVSPGVMQVDLKTR